MSNAVADASLDLDVYLSKTGEAAENLGRLWLAIWRQSYVPASTLELCRLTLARLHGSEGDMACQNEYLPDGALPPEKRHAVLSGQAVTDSIFSHAEIAALQLAEIFWIDPAGIDDGVANQVKSSFGEEGLLLLCEALGCFDSRIRASLCLRGLGSLTGNDGGQAC